MNREKYFNPTPGNWFVDTKALGAPEVKQHDSNGRRIAKVLYEGGSEDREVTSNAHLISYTPQMLAILEVLAERDPEDIVNVNFSIIDAKRLLEEIKSYGL